MTLDPVIEEYIRKHFYIEDEKLFRVINHVINPVSRCQVSINQKFFATRKIFEYLRTGKWLDNLTPINNKSGHKGVCYKSNKGWEASLRRKNVCLRKYCKTKEEAIEARNKIFDEYNNKKV
jgi:hypothetical protein